MSDNKKIEGRALNYLVGSLTALVVVLAAGGYFYYKLDQTVKELNLTKAELSNTKSDLAQSQERAASLENELGTEKYKNSLFSGQISEIAGTVGTLDKLAKTDKELLQKYSKIYFLNENYMPKGLLEIPSEYLYDQDKVIRIHNSVSPYLLDMMNDAKRHGANLLVISGFRSFGDQSSLKSSYKFTYGSGANQFSADQGYSEHQLGTTVDFTSFDLGADFGSFGKSKEYEWLLDNAYKYGFIISYPEGNAYYQYEPWHWRFVGRSLAERLHEEKQNFYDLDQRQIDAYLIKLFD